MNRESINSAHLIKNAKTALEIGQRQLKEAVSIYKVHGKQLLTDGKAFYQDLWDLQSESVSEIKKVFTSTEEGAEDAKEASVKRAGASKKKPQAKAKAEAKSSAEA